MLKCILDHIFWNLLHSFNAQRKVRTKERHCNALLTLDDKTRKSPICNSSVMVSLCLHHHHHLSAPCHRFYPSCGVFTPGDGECQVTVTLSHSHIQIGFMPNQKLIICSKCIVHVHYSYNFYKIQPSSIWQSCQTDNCQGVGFRGGTHAHKFLRSIK